MFIKVDEVFGGIKPLSFYQNENTGSSNIESATAAIYDLLAFRAETLDESEWHSKLVDVIEEFNGKAKYI